MPHQVERSCRGLFKSFWITEISTKRTWFKLLLKQAQLWGTTLVCVDMCCMFFLWADCWNAPFSWWCFGLGLIGRLWHRWRTNGSFAVLRDGENAQNSWDNHFLWNIYIYIYIVRTLVGIFLECSQMNTVDRNWHMYKYICISINHWKFISVYFGYGFTSIHISKALDDLKHFAKVGLGLVKPSRCLNEQIGWVIYEFYMSYMWVIRFLKNHHEAGVVVDVASCCMNKQINIRVIYSIHIGSWRLTIHYTPT